MYGFPGASLALSRHLRPVKSSRRAQVAFSRFYRENQQAAQLEFQLYVPVTRKVCEIFFVSQTHKNVCKPIGSR